MNSEKALHLEPLLEKLYTREYMPTEGDIGLICQLARESLREDKIVLQLRLPVVVVGDVHGQFFDLLEIFRMAGRAPVACGERSTRTTCSWVTMWTVGSTL